MVDPFGIQDAGPPNSWFAAKLTLDGLLTFLGGLLAVFAVLYQVRRADRGLQEQLKAEKQARREEAQERQRRVAVALLFEINTYWAGDVRNLLKVLEALIPSSVPPTLKPRSASPFPVYVGNAGALGGLPPILVETVVGYYGLLRSYEATLVQYSQGFDLLMADNIASGRALTTSMIARIKAEAPAITQVAYTACGLLCHFVDIEFSYPRIAVADDPHVDESSRKTLADGLQQLDTEIGHPA
jgi:hypothetical protein